MKKFFRWVYSRLTITQHHKKKILENRIGSIQAYVFGAAESKSGVGSTSSGYVQGQAKVKFEKFIYMFLESDSSPFKWEIFRDSFIVTLISSSIELFLWYLFFLLWNDLKGGCLLCLIPFWIPFSLFNDQQ